MLMKIFQCMLVEFIGKINNIRFHTYWTIYSIKHTVYFILFRNHTFHQHHGALRVACSWQFFIDKQVFRKHSISPTSFTNDKTAVFTSNIKYIYQLIQLTNITEESKILPMFLQDNIRLYTDCRRYVQNVNESNPGNRIFSFEFSTK